MVNAYRTGHKLAWDVPRSCHTYLVDEVLAPHMASLEATLLSRFVGFFRSLVTSPSGEVMVLALLAARDLRSSLGSNLALVREKTGLDPWVAGSSELHSSLEAATTKKVPDQDFWRPQLLQQLLAARLQAHYRADGKEEERLAHLITSLVTN